MSKPAEQKQKTMPKDPTERESKKPENWPDVPENRAVENVEKRGNERVEQMRHADNSTALASSTTDTTERVVGHTDALVDEELDRKSGREEVL
jgi:hypothetical protein